MKKPLKKILVGALLTTLIFFSVLAVLILNPQLLFAKRAEYKNFNIYSSAAPPDYYKTTLDYAIKRIEKSELYDPKQKFDVFLCHQTFYNDLIAKFIGYAMAQNLYDNILLRVEADFERNILIGWNSNRNLKKTIAHEAIHVFQIQRFGLLKFNPINHPPIWKIEGYPEYIAYQENLKAPSYRLVESIKKLQKFEKSGEYWYPTEPGQYDPLVYFKGRVMIEFLKDIKKLSYTQILNDDITENSVMTEMMTWYDKQAK